MAILPFRRLSQVVCGLLITVGAGWAADSAPTTVVRSQSQSAPRPASTRGGIAKGPLPDPLLLDGSTQTAEKKSEYGMIGDFELPGDENARSGKAGGQQDPNAKQGGGGQQGGAQGQQGGAQGQSGGQQGGAQGGQQGGQQGGAPGRQGGPQGQQGGAQGAAGAIPVQEGGAQQAGGGGQAGGPDNPNAAGNPVGGAGDPGGQPQGVQVAELGGSPSNQPGAAGGGTPGGKPAPVGIGDKAMRIEGPPPSPDVVGAQKQIADGHVQQHEKGTGTGGKGPTAPQGPGRIEKGRTIPAGL